MSSVAVIYNNDCIKCGDVLLEMTRVGAVVFCPKCFGEEFKTDDPVANERDTYLKWVEAQKQKMQKRAEEQA